jgi:hypothetical protein
VPMIYVEIFFLGQNAECSFSDIQSTLFMSQGRGNKSSGDNFHAAPNIDHSQNLAKVSSLD